jgi:hypothetical protein
LRFALVQAANPGHFRNERFDNPVDLLVHACTHLGTINISRLERSAKTNEALGLEAKLRLWLKCAVFWNPPVPKAVRLSASARELSCLIARQGM